MSNNSEGIIYIVGIGPGCEELNTINAAHALDNSDVIIGYKTYIDLIKDRYPNKELMSTPMKQEVERVNLCFTEAKKGKSVALVCSGDAGVYGLASLVYECKEKLSDNDIKIEVVPGVTAALSGAALLGAPINHDFCTISLSDLMTPWELIANRLKKAAEGDFSIVLYNPGSHARKDYLKRAIDILMPVCGAHRVCGLVRNIGRPDTHVWVGEMTEMSEIEVDMFTTVFVGNSETRIIDGKMVTPRGYL